MKKININKKTHIWLLGMIALLSVMTIAAMWLSIINSTNTKDGMTALGHTFAGLFVCGIILELIASIFDKDRKNWVQTIIFGVITVVHIVLWILNGLWVIGFTAPALHTVVYVITIAICLYFLIAEYWNEKTPQDKAKEKDAMANQNAVVEQTDHKITYEVKPDVVTESIKQESNDEGTI